MAGVEQFEDLIAWQRARELTKSVLRVTQIGRFSRNFGLADQIQRASVSIMSNIAEGFERGSAAEFHHFLVIAKASCAEVRSLLYVALDGGYIDEATFSALRGQTIETGRVVGGLRSSVQKRRDQEKGPRRQ